MTAPGVELDLFGLPAPVEPTRDELAQVAPPPEPSLEPGQHVERALSAELEDEPEETVETEEQHDGYVVVTAAPAVPVDGEQAALFDLGGLTKADPLAEVRAQWNASEATTPEARLEVFRSVTVKAMKLAYKLGDYERIISQFGRVCKALDVRNPSEAIPLLLDFYERTNANGH